MGVHNRPFETMVRANGIDPDVACREAPEVEREPRRPIRVGPGRVGARRLLSTCLAACGLLSACATISSQGTPGELIDRTRMSASREWIVVNGGGRDIRSLVLLPDGYADGGDYPLLVAVHNFAGNAEGFADLIHAERLRTRGVVLVLPQAAGRIPDWRGPGLTLLAHPPTASGQPVDDIAGVAATLEVAKRLYRVAPSEINITGFSQGATLALALTRRLDAARPGDVRRLFMVAGSAAGPVDASLALEGSDLVAYQPGHNGMQSIANWLTREPTERLFMPEILRAKGCAPQSNAQAAGETAGVDRHDYRCADGRTVVHLFEAQGEHAWPGQNAKYDSRVMGRGSISKVDFTGLIAETIVPAPSR
jgi:poly(3-hydroxybutyrate) depolymerase